MKILIIGNSFGQDASRYLHGVSRFGGEEITVVNLYIGGCSLYRHYRNMLSGQADYAYEINGNSTGLFVSLKQALLLQEWDAVVMQQCSPESGEYEKYQPFLHELCNYVAKYCPRAKRVLHMTWTFAHGCSRFGITPFSEPEEMLPAIENAYERAMQDEAFAFMIPSGRAMAKLYREAGPGIYRDGFHCNYGYTRYMLACLWFMAFTGRDIAGNAWRDFDIPVIDEEMLRSQRIARETLYEAGFCLG